MVSHEVFSTSMIRPIATRLLASCLLLGLIPGCDGQPPAQPPASSASTAPSAESLVITDLVVSQKTLVGAEYLDVDMTVERPGSQTITKYGLRTPYGEKIFTFKPSLTVIPSGKVSLQKIGPPAVSKAGPMTIEIWLIDSAGTQSNVLTAEVTVQ